MHSRLFVVAMLMACARSSVAAPPDAAAPSSIDLSVYFHADVRDAEVCANALRVEDGEVVYTVSNPAVTCPDAVAWANFAKAIEGEFWTWGTDQTVWPSQPAPLCGTELASAIGGACCDADGLGKAHDGAPNEACPYQPADWSDAPPSAQGAPGFQHGRPILTTIDPGRVIRQDTAEIVYRNTPFIRYVIEQNLYSREGLGAHQRLIAASALNQAPYQVARPVSFPPDAVMVKADWVHQDVMLDFGLIQKRHDGKRLDPPNNPELPYVTMSLPGDASDPEKAEAGMYYLLSLTNASKELPEWHWYAIEHAGNLGRCDYTGCNDSFGYASAGNGEGAGSNFVPPMTESDGLSNASAIFVTGKPYTDTGETQTEGLKALYQGLGIGTAGSDPDPSVPAASDPAWASYRLKGSQTNWTDGYGTPNILGASITEGGFVNSSSCMTCHTQASVDADGLPIPGVGSSSRLNLIGYNQSSHGAPEQNMFFSPGTNQYDTVRIDYVWGLLNAACIQGGGDPTAPGACETYEGALRE